MTDPIGTEGFNVDLPPAGAVRREVLAERTDLLEQAGEEQFADRGAIPHDSPVLRPEENREIQQHIHKSHLDIGADHPFLKTKWVNWKNQEGQMIWQAKSDGWNVATIKEFPEAKGLQKEDGTIRVADVLLMCIRLDAFLQLINREAQKRIRQQYGIESDIHQLAAKYPDVFKNVHTELSGGVPEDIMNVVESRATRRSAAHRVAAKTLGNQMKTGTIPGVPIR